MSPAKKELQGGPEHCVSGFSWRSWAAAQNPCAFEESFSSWIPLRTKFLPEWTSFLCDSSKGQILSGTSGRSRHAFWFLGEVCQGESLEPGAWLLSFKSWLRTAHGGRLNKAYLSHSLSFLSLHLEGDVEIIADKKAKPRECLVWVGHSLHSLAPPGGPPPPRVRAVICWHHWKSPIDIFKLSCISSNNIYGSPGLMCLCFS